MFPRSDDVIDHRPNGTAGLARAKGLLAGANGVSAGSSLARLRHRW